MNVSPARRFRWDELPADAPMALLERRRVIGERAMISHVTLFAGCFVPTHRHANEQITCVISGRLRFQIGDGDDQETVVVSEGEVLHLPSGVSHSAEAEVETVVLDVFSPPSETTGIDGRP